MGGMTPLQLQRLLDRAGFSQRGMAKELQINERTMRRYCSGEQKIPWVVEYAILFVCYRKDGTIKTGSTA
jgi:hypothetical protein